MELNDVYSIANAINESIMKGDIKPKTLEDFTIEVKVSPTILYGIDKEFYRLSHENDVSGFEHGDEVNAVIDNIKFRFVKSKVQQ